MSKTLYFRGRAIATMTERDEVRLQALRDRAGASERRERRHKLAGTPLGTDHPTLLMLEKAEYATEKHGELCETHTKFAEWCDTRGLADDALDSRTRAAENLEAMKRQACRVMALLPSMRPLMRSHAYALEYASLCMAEATEILPISILPTAPKCEPIASHLSAQAPPREGVASNGGPFAFTSLGA